MKCFKPIKFEVREIIPQKYPTHSVIAIDKEGYGREYGVFWDKKEAKAYSEVHNTLIFIHSQKPKKST